MAVIKCDICSLATLATRNLNVAVDSEDGVHGEFYNTELNVCDKCLPNLLVMFEVAIMKTSKIMVAANENIIGTKDKVKKGKEE